MEIKIERKEPINANAHAKKRNHGCLMDCNNT